MIDTVMVLWTKGVIRLLTRALIAFFILFVCVGGLLYYLEFDNVHWASQAYTSTPVAASDQAIATTSASQAPTSTPQMHPSGAIPTSNCGASPTARPAAHKTT